MEVMEKFKQLEENIKLLQEIKEELPSNKTKRVEWEVRYGLFESIQIVIDISCKISSVYNLGNPKTYRECVELLEKFNYLDNNLSTKIKAMVGFRNILVHEYVEIDNDKLFMFLENLDDFREFIKSIKKELKG